MQSTSIYIALISYEAKYVLRSSFTIIIVI
jgi:hypothetical protein